MPPWRRENPVTEQDILRNAGIRAKAIIAEAQSEAEANKGARQGRRGTGKAGRQGQRELDALIRSQTEEAKRCF